jgi:hypothetical protein
VVISINKLIVTAGLILLFTVISVRDSQAVGSQNKPIQNQVKTQNLGDDQQLQVETREQEGTQSGRGEGLETRSQTAVQNMSTVAQKVQEMLQLKTTGGIGDQVRQIARDQNQAQTQIQEHLDKIESKGGLAKFFFGPDYKALSDAQKLLEQNRLRIQELQQLHTQLKNTGDQTVIQAAIQALEQQNVSLQNKLDTENKTFSLFGWLAKILTR